MKVDFQRKVDQIAGPLICRALSAWRRIRREPDAPGAPARILVILLSEMGSLVLAKPMFLRLRERYPQASFYALLFRQNRQIMDVLDVVPREHVLTVRNASLSVFLSDCLAVWRKMRRLEIDAVIDCELFSRISSIFSFLSGAGIRVGFHPHTQEGLYRGSFINRPVLYNPYHHISQQFLKLADAIDSAETPPVKRPVSDQKPAIARFEADPEEISRFEERFRADFPQTVGRRMVLLYPGGGLLPIRAWPLSHFCRVASELTRGGFAVGVIGLSEDGEAARTIQAHCGGELCVDLTGYTRTMRELLLLFHLASLLIANDGGPGHFASMVRLRAIVLYGPETPALYGTLDDGSVDLFADYACSPCLTAYNHRNSPCDGDNACLKAIFPERVLAIARGMLSSEPGPGCAAGGLDGMTGTGAGVKPVAAVRERGPMHDETG